MEIGEVLYVKNRKEWRNWLKKNYLSSKEIWLLYYKKHSGKPRIPYDDAVEEALCFGWIDSILKKNDNESHLQRFSPRRKKSVLSEMNKDRVRRMIEAEKMTERGLESIKQYIHYTKDGKPEVEGFDIPEDIIAELKKDSEVWKNFSNFPEYYKNIRIGFIDSSRNRPEYFKKRLANFIKMTKQNKKFGMIQ